VSKPSLWQQQFRSFDQRQQQLLPDETVQSVSEGGTA
jgi:hypothetical protein